MKALLLGAAIALLVIGTGGIAFGCTLDWTGEHVGAAFVTGLAFAYLMAGFICYCLVMALLDFSERRDDVRNQFIRAYAQGRY